MSKLVADLLALYLSAFGLFVAYIYCAHFSYKTRGVKSSFYLGSIVPFRLATESVIRLSMIASAAAVGSIIIYVFSQYERFDGITRAYTTSVLALVTFLAMSSTIHLWASRNLERVTKIQATTGQCFITMLAVLILCGYMLAASLFWDSKHQPEWIELGACALAVTVAFAIIHSIHSLKRGVFSDKPSLGVYIERVLPDVSTYLRGVVKTLIILVIGASLMSVAFQGNGTRRSQDFSPAADLAVSLGSIITASVCVVSRSSRRSILNGLANVRDSFTLSSQDFLIRGRVLAHFLIFVTSVFVAMLYPIEAGGPGRLVRLLAILVCVIVLCLQMHVARGRGLDADDALNAGASDIPALFGLAGLILFVVGLLIQNQALMGISGIGWLIAMGILTVQAGDRSVDDTS